MRANTLGSAFSHMDALDLRDQPASRNSDGAASIFVVEDEGIVANNISDSLVSAGYRIAGIAGSGEDALHRITETRPDLVLMDIHLSGEMDGVEAARQVNEDLDVPVIYLTAYADTKTLNRAKPTAPFGFLAKPVKQASLHTAIEVALNKSSLERKLKERVGWLTNVLLSSPDPTAVVDPEGKIQFMNVEASLLIDCSPDDWTNRTFAEIVPLYQTDTGLPAEDLVARALSEKTAFNFPRGLCFRNRANKEILIEGEVAAGLFGQHANVGAVITFRDVSRLRDSSPGELNSQPPTRTTSPG